MNSSIQLNNVEHEPWTPGAMPQVRAETEALLLCARVCMSPATVDRVKHLVDAAFDFEWLFTRAREQGVFQLVFHNMRTLCGKQIPEQLSARLWSEFHDNARRQVILTQEMLRFTSLLEQNGIPVMPFKGPVLAVQSYGNLAMRSFGDIDVLVRPDDVDKATALLKTEGYSIPDDPGDPQANQYLALPFFMESAQSQRVITFERNGMVTEVHWDFTPQRLRVQRDLSPLWTNAVTISLLGQTCRVMDSNDRTISLCLHGAKHYWDRLSYICDLAESVRSAQDLDWNVVTSEAARSGSLRIVMVGVLLIHRLYAANVPAHVIAAALADVESCKLAANITQHLLAELETGAKMISAPGQVMDQTRRHSRLQTYAFSFKVRERLRDKILYMLYLFLKPTKEEWDLLRLPVFLSGFYYILRPLRLLTLHTRPPLRLDRRKGVI